METDRSKICGCKGIRTCLKCEKMFNILPKSHPSITVSNHHSYVYCSVCGKCWPGWNANKHNNHSGKPIHLDGVNIFEEFLSVDEEEQLITDLNNLPWELSQSGRRKQNFGPKCNFKKRKLRLGTFRGFPECTRFVQEKFESVDIMRDFHAIEQCTLEYDPQRGASIDPHIDDCWIWGERIVTVNLLADAILTMTPYRRDGNRYNHDFAPDKFKTENDSIVQAIRIPLPRRSLLVLTGESRYFWLHQIYREDICLRRLCLAFREFTPDYLPGGQFEEEGEEILEIGKHFWI